MFKCRKYTWVEESLESPVCVMSKGLLFKIMSIAFPRKLVRFEYSKMMYNIVQYSIHPK